MAQNCYGEQMLAMGTLLSVQLAQGRTEAELAVLAALLTVIADQLALLAVFRATPEERGELPENL